VTEDKEQETPKDEQRSTASSSGSQPSSDEESLTPPSSVRRPLWSTQTLRDAQEHVEAPKSTFKESRPSRKFPNYLALLSSIINVEPSSFEEAADQQVWRDAMVEDYNSIVKNDVWDIV
jgi:hypothetical protein